MKEDIAQLTVNVPIKHLWRGLASDMRHVIPKVLPDIVAEIELLEGDGGLGSIFLFKFNPSKSYFLVCFIYEWLTGNW